MRSPSPRAPRSLRRRFVLVLVFFFVVGLNLQTSAREAPKIKVLTTILPMFCFAKSVAGDAAEVENLLPGGVGPHDYQLSPRDLRKINAADLIIKNGLNLEGWLDKVIAANRDGARAVVVEAAAGLEGALIHAEGAHDHEGHEHHESEDHAAHGADPHVWLDPTLAERQVANIVRALQARDPRNATVYERNGEAFIARLKALDIEIQQTLEPVRDRAFVTYHNAFPYFVRRYQLNLAGVVEATADVPPSPRYLRDLNQTIRDRQAKAIFTEPQFSSKLVRQLARDLKLKVGELDPLETGKLRATAYEEGMRRNAQQLRDFLR